MLRKVVGIIGGLLIVVGAVLLATASDIEQAKRGFFLITVGDLILIGAYIALVMTRNAPCSLWKRQYWSCLETRRLKAKGILSLPIEDSLFLIAISMAVIIGGAMFAIGEPGSTIVNNNFVLGAYWMGILCYHIFLAFFLFVMVGTGALFAYLPSETLSSNINKERLAAIRQELSKTPWLIRKIVVPIVAVATLLIFILVLFGGRIVAPLYLHSTPILESQWYEERAYEGKSGCFVVVPDFYAEKNIVRELVEKVAWFTTGQPLYPEGSELWCIHTPADFLIGELLRTLPSLKKVTVRTTADLPKND